MMCRCVVSLCFGPLLSKLPVVLSSSSRLTQRTMSDLCVHQPLSKVGTFGAWRCPVSESKDVGTCRPFSINHRSRPAIALSFHPPAKPDPSPKPLGSHIRLTTHSGPCGLRTEHLPYKLHPVGSLSIETRFFAQQLRGEYTSTHI